MSKIKNNITMVALSLLIGLTLVSGITYATVTWQDTGWIQNGAKIDASKIKKSLDYLRENITSMTTRITNVEHVINDGTGHISTVTPTDRSHVATKGYVDDYVNNIKNISKPPTCIGTNRYLQWDGTTWKCSNASVGK